MSMNGFGVREITAGMTNKIIVIGAAIALVIWLIFLVGCVESKDYIPPKQKSIENLARLMDGIKPGFYRFVDVDGGATCWIYKDTGGHNSISCLPIEQTQLGRE